MATMTKTVQNTLWSLSWKSEEVNADEIASETSPKEKRINVEEDTKEKARKCVSKGDHSEGTKQLKLKRQIKKS